MQLMVIDETCAITDPNRLVAFTRGDGFNWDWEDAQGYLFSASEQEALTTFARGLGRGITALIAGREVTSARLVARW